MSTSGEGEGASDLYRESPGKPRPGLRVNFLAFKQEIRSVVW